MSRDKVQFRPEWMPLVAAPPRRFSDHAVENGHAHSGKNVGATRGIIDEALDSRPVVEWFKAAAEIASGKDIIVDKKGRIPFKGSPFGNMSDYGRRQHNLHKYGRSPPY